MRPEMVGFANPAASHGGATTFMEEDGDQPTCSSASFSSTLDEASADSSSTSDLTDDASSAPACSPPPPPAELLPPCHQPQTAARGPLYELSSLMAQLPAVKPGLSKFFPGKSRSFASLSNARCIEDLPKKEVPYRRKMMKPCRRRSCGEMVEFGSRSYFAPGPYGKPISKKSPKGSCAYSLAARLGGAAAVASSASRRRCL